MGVCVPVMRWGCALIRKWCRVKLSPASALIWFCWGPNGYQKHLMSYCAVVPLRYQGALVPNERLARAGAPVSVDGALSFRGVFSIQNVLGARRVQVLALQAPWQPCPRELAAGWCFSCVTGMHRHCACRRGHRCTHLAQPFAVAEAPRAEAARVRCILYVKVNGKPIHMHHCCVSLAPRCHGLSQSFCGHRNVMAMHGSGRDGYACADGHIWTPMHALPSRHHQVKLHQSRLFAIACCSAAPERHMQYMNVRRQRAGREPVGLQNRATRADQGSSIWYASCWAPATVDVSTAPRKRARLLDIRPFHTIPHEGFDERSISI